MKNALTLFFSLVLSMCLALYGPSGVAKTDTNGAVISMEICANGVVATVYIDANGQPVEPDRSCYECLTCCATMGGHPDILCNATLILSLLEIEQDRIVSEIPQFEKNNLRPEPRGPPLARLSIYGPFQSREGRPFLKDAIA